MRYDDSIVEQVKARALFDVLGPADEKESKRAGSGRKAYKCPLCGHSRIVNPLPDGRWYCQRCQKGGNVFQLVAMRDGITDGEAFKKVMQKYTGGEVERPAAAVQTVDPEKPSGQVEGWAQRCAAYLRQCAARFDGSRAAAYMQDERGLTLETCHRFGCGYDDKAMKRAANFGGSLKFGAPAVIYPYSRRLDYYGARLIKPTGELEKAYQPNAATAGNEPLFNAAALYGLETVIAVEGPFDAMAITQAAGGLNVGAIALCGTGAGKLIRQLQAKASAARLLLLMDNDEAGQKAIPAITGQLQAIKQPFEVLDSGACLAGFKDPAELLRVEGDAIVSEMLRFIIDCKESRL